MGTDPADDAKITARVKHIIRVFSALPAAQQKRFYDLVPVEAAQATMQAEIKAKLGIELDLGNGEFTTKLKAAYLADTAKYIATAELNATAGTTAYADNQILDALVSTLSVRLAKMARGDKSVH